MPWRSRILAGLEATARRAALKRARVHVGREHGAAGAPFPSDRIVIPSHASWNLASNLAHHNLPDARGSFATGDAVSHGVLRPAGPQKSLEIPGFERSKQNLSRRRAKCCRRARAGARSFSRMPNESRRGRKKRGDKRRALGGMGGPRTKKPARRKVADGKVSCAPPSLRPPLCPLCKFAGRCNTLTSDPAAAQPPSRSARDLHLSKLMTSLRSERPRPVRRSSSWPSHGRARKACIRSCR